MAGGGLAGGILARTCLEEWNLTKGICYKCSIPQNDMHHKQVLAPMTIPYECINTVNDTKYHMASHPP